MTWQGPQIAWGGSALPPHTCWPGVQANNISFQLANRAFYFRSLGVGSVSNVLIPIATQSGNICVGIYNSNGGFSKPQRLVATSGTVACPAASLTPVAIPLNTTVNVDQSFYFAIACDNTTASFQCTGSGFNASGPEGFAYQDLVASQMPLQPTPSNNLQNLRSAVILMLGA